MTDWESFVASVEHHLRHVLELSGSALDNEHDLVERIALDLRERLFYAVSPEEHPYHVVYRDGRTEDDRKAWRLAKKVKWLRLHGLDFVPDVIISRQSVRTLTAGDDKTILPIEVKLVKKASCSNEIARGVGQCLAYNTRYPQSILFVGVNPGSYGRKRGLQPTAKDGDDEKKFNARLRQQGVALIFRDVGTA